MLRVYNDTARYVDQGGGKRKGSFAVYLEPWHEDPGLQDTYGAEFEALYNKYVAEGKPKKTFKAQQLWFKILESQMETGTPYMLYKDACNKKSNQKNLGTIKSSNL